jgi:type III restriction enzyme
MAVARGLHIVFPLLVTVSIAPHETHAGYFSIDKHGRKVDSPTKRGSDESDDISAYDLILKHKERLLSFHEPVRFIFSHSALREGWDNPNVFQICTLKHGGASSTQKRQEVGRGLRLCVNQRGERMDMEACGDSVHSLNVLTVIASEGYKDFVADLQVGIKEALYDRPTRATAEYFTGKTVKIGEKLVVLDAKQARDIYRYLIKNDYVDDNERRFAQDLEDASEVAVYAKLPRGFAIPTRLAIILRTGRLRSTRER